MRILRNHRARRTARYAVAVAALCVCVPSAVATTTHVYQWQEANGSAVLSNLMPPPRITHYWSRDVQTRTLSAQRREALDQQLASDRASLTVAVAAPNDDEIAAARAALAQARHEREVMRAPLPNERLHNANGHSRLAPWYFERQERLDRAVADAEAHLRDVLAQRNLVRSVG